MIATLTLDTADLTRKLRALDARLADFRDRMAASPEQADALAPEFRRLVSEAWAIDNEIDRREGEDE